MKRILIVGASLGLGAEIAKQLLEKKFNSPECLVLMARSFEFSENKVDWNKFGNQDCCLKIIKMDVTSEEFKIRFSEVLTSNKIDTVINCAGIGFIQPFTQSPLSDAIVQTKLNVETLTVLSHVVGNHFSKKFSEQKYEKNIILPFKLIHISSSAAFSPLPGMAVYAATKSYVVSLCLALDKEFAEFGASVTVVCPGPLKTTLFDWNKTGWIAASQVQLPETCAKEVILGIRDNKKIIVTGFSNKLLFVMSEFLPTQVKKNIAAFYLKAGKKKI